MVQGFIDVGASGQHIVILWTFSLVLKMFVMSGIKQLFHYADRSCGLEIWIGNSEGGFSLLYNFWGLWWEDMNRQRLESYREFCILSSFPGLH
jgi:hypothetical protein